MTGTGHGTRRGCSPATGRSQLSGPVGIVRVSQQQLQVGLTYYLEILAFVSMSLALLNLLPLLPLDGGHILFSLIEGVRRRALAREVYERVSVVGFALHPARVRDRVLERRLRRAALTSAQRPLRARFAPESAWLD